LLLLLLLLAVLADIKLAVLSTPTAMDKGYDITLHSGQPVKKTSEVGAFTNTWCHVSVAADQSRRLS
jgi:hypothetical protein